MLNGQLRFLHAAAAQGLPVQMVELGNELYLDGFHNTAPGPDDQDYAERFPTAADYATQMNAWIRAIHNAFPAAQAAAVATDANFVSNEIPRRLTWNATILPLLRGENAVTVHENMRVYRANTSVPALLAEPYLHYQALAAHEMQVFQTYNIPVWISEFNLADLSPGHKFQGTWVNGLFVVSEALLFLSNPEITYVGLNETAGDSPAAIFANSGGFGPGGPPTVPLALTAGGTTPSVIQTAFHQATSACPLAFSPSVGLGATGAPALLGEEVTTPLGPQLLLLNLSSRPITLGLPAIFPKGFAVTQTSAPSAMTQVTGPTSLTTSSTTGSGELQIGPYALADVSATWLPPAPRSWICPVPVMTRDIRAAAGRGWDDAAWPASSIRSAGSAPW